MTFRPNLSKENTEKFSYLNDNVLIHSHDIHTHDSELCCNISPSKHSDET